MSTINLYNLQPDQVKMMHNTCVRYPDGQFPRSLSPPTATPVCGQPDSINALLSTDAFSVHLFSLPEHAYALLLNDNGLNVIMAFEYCGFWTI